MKFPAFEPIELKSLDTNEININLLIPDINQPRKHFDIESLNNLSLSIKQHGVLQPILVRKIENGNEFQIIAGERRWRAAKIAGLTSVPAIVKTLNTIDQMAISLIENLQRENLNPIEEAFAIYQLIDEFYLTHQQVAEKLGKSRAAVSNLLRLLSLNENVKDLVRKKELEMGHARALLAVEYNEQLAIAEKVIKQKLNVRETEHLVSSIKKSIPSLSLNNFYNEKCKIWNKILTDKFLLETNVNIQQNGQGKIVIKIDSVNDIEFLIENV